MINRIVFLIPLSYLSLLLYGNGRDFYALIFYPVTLPNSFISTSFLVAEHHVICKQLQFYFFFLIWIIFLIWLLWLGLPKQCWINVAGVDILSWSQRKCFQFFTFENDVCCGFVIYDFYYVEVGSLCALFLERFYHKRLFNFVKSLPCIHWNYHMNFILQFVNMVYQFSCSVVSDSLWPYGLQHTRLPCPSPNSGACSNSCPLS